MNEQMSFKLTLINYVRRLSSQVLKKLQNKKPKQTLNTDNSVLNIETKFVFCFTRIIARIFELKILNNQNRFFVKNIDFESINSITQHGTIFEPNKS